MSSKHEKLYLEAWKKLNDSKRAKPEIEEILGNEVSSRDIEVATKIVKWLGSDLGLYFVGNTLGCTKGKCIFRDGA